MLRKTYFRVVYIMKVVVFIFAAAVAVKANQKCTGVPRKLNGKLCASTTHYHDNQKGACGCGTDPNTPFSWNMHSYTVAANQMLFDSPRDWCGKTCGRCVKLTTTGGYVEHEGTAPKHGAGQSVVFMITNECPRNGNMKWCGQKIAPYECEREHSTCARHGGLNDFGYAIHFDVETGGGQVNQLGWDNPEVTMEFVDCNNAHAHNSKTPSIDMYHQCQCTGGNGKK